MVGENSSQDASSLIQEATLPTKHHSGPERVYDLMSGIGPSGNSRTKRKPCRTNSACSSSKIDGSRCSGERPACRCRSGKNLERPLGISEDTPQRSIYKSKALVGVETGREASTARALPLQPRSACMQCQKRKGKCTGERPVCRYCSDRGLDCSWDVADGLTRTSDLKRRLQKATTRLLAPDLIFAALRDGTDNESTEVLARLRLGDTNAQVILTLTEGHPSSQLEASEECPEVKSNIVSQIGRSSVS